MLARKKLIPLTSEFDRIRQTGKMYDSPSFGLLVAFSKEQVADSAKCAFVVSKKIDKKSVIRHQVKRKLAEAVTSFLPRLPKHAELVFLAKQKAASEPVEQLKVEIDSVLRRSKLI